MLAEALREGLAHLVGSVLLTEDRVAVVLREALKRYGVEPEEIERAVEEAKANLSRWRGEGPAGPSLGEAAASGIAKLLGTLGIPTKSDLQELAGRIEDAIRAGAPAASVPGHAGPSAGSGTTPGKKRSHPAGPVEKSRRNDKTREKKT